MSSSTIQLDRERRFQPTREALEAFLWEARPWTRPCVYDPQWPIAFTRTTYFDTAGCELLASCRSGSARRVRLREYAGTTEPTRAPRLSGERFLELKTSLGERRTKLRTALSAEEAQALLTGLPLPERGPAAGLLRQLALEPVRPWVTAWYRRSTYSTPRADVRLTVDEDLLFALPPEHGVLEESAVPSRLLERVPTPLLEVKWCGAAPAWLEELLWMMGPFETRGSKFEQGMRARQGRHLVGGP